MVLISVNNNNNNNNNNNLLASLHPRAKVKYTNILIINISG